MKRTLLLLLAGLACSLNSYSVEIILTPSGGGNDALLIQNTLDTIHPGDTLVLQGSFSIARTIYLPSDFTWMLEGSLALLEDVDLDRVGFTGPGVDARRPTGITEKPGGATNIEMSGGTYYGSDIRDGSSTVRFLNFVSVTNSYFHDFQVVEGSDDGFTLGPESRYNECRELVGSGANGNALTDKGEYNKWYDCVAEDCGSDGWTPKCRYSEFYRCIGRRNAGPGFGCFARLDGSGNPVDLGEIIVGNKFIACEAYENQRGGFSFNIASTSGEGSIIRDNYIQALCYDNQMQGVGFRNKQPSGIIENNEVDIIVFGNLGLKDDGTLSSYAGGLGVEGEISGITGSVIGYKNGGYDVNLKSATQCSLDVYQPGSQLQPVINTNSGGVRVLGFLCTDTLNTWCQATYCEKVAPLLPDPPKEVSATGISSRQVDLSWSGNAGNSDGILIERTSDETFSLLDTVNANVDTFSDTTVLSETTYRYRMRSFNHAGYSAYSEEIEVTTDAVVSVSRETAGEYPGLFMVPNPFRETTRLTFTLQRNSSVSLRVMDAAGREIETLVEENLPRGAHTISFHGTDFPGGVVYFRLQTGNRVLVTKGILLR